MRKRQAACFQAAVDFRILNPGALRKSHGIAKANRHVQLIAAE